MGGDGRILRQLVIEVCSDAVMYLDEHLGAALRAIAVLRRYLQRQLVVVGIVLDAVVAPNGTLAVTATITDVNGVDAVAADASTFGAGTLTLSDGDEYDVYDERFTVGDADAGDHSVTVNATHGPGNDATADTNALTVATDIVVDTDGGGGGGGGESRDSVDRGSVTVDVQADGGRTIRITVDDPRPGECVVVDTREVDLVTDDLVKLHSLEFRVLEPGDLEPCPRNAIKETRRTEVPPAARKIYEQVNWDEIEVQTDSSGEITGVHAPQNSKNTVNSLNEELAGWPARHVYNHYAVADNGGIFDEAPSLDKTLTAKISKLKN